MIISYSPNLDECCCCCCVDVKEEKICLVINNYELTNIIHHIEENNFSHIQVRHYFEVEQ